MLDTSALRSALGQLETSLVYLRSEASQRDAGLRQQFRAAVIQAFEFTYELAIRMTRRQLAEIVATPADLREMAFMDLMRAASDAGLIRDARPFKLYRDRRNETAHTYDAAKAEQVLSIVEDFVADVRFLHDELARRNDAGA